MAALSVQLDKPSYVFGEQVTATLVVSGADPEQRTVTGRVVLDGGPQIEGTINYTLTHVETGHQVTQPGASFTQDATNPRVFRGAAA